MTKTARWCDEEMELGEALESPGAVRVPTAAAAVDGETPAAMVGFRLDVEQPNNYRRCVEVTQ